MPNDQGPPCESCFSFEGRRLLRTHQELLNRWRKAMNLVGPGPTDVHYQDSRRALSWLRPQGSWADLGTGAGFPGIVFAALFPEVHIDLVDSRAKRCRFLDETLAQADWLTATVHCTRHETLAANAYDGIMSRALHAPEVMLDVGRRLLKPGGTLVLFLQADADVPEAPDYQVFHVEHYVVDGKRRKSAGLHFQP